MEYDGPLGVSPSYMYALILRWSHTTLPSFSIHSSHQASLDGRLSPPLRTQLIPSQPWRSAPTDQADPTDRYLCFQADSDRHPPDQSNFAATRNDFPTWSRKRHGAEPVDSVLVSQLGCFLLQRCWVWVRSNQQKLRARKQQDYARGPESASGYGQSRPSSPKTDQRTGWISRWVAKVRLSASP